VDSIGSKIFDCQIAQLSKLFSFVLRVLEEVEVIFVIEE